MIRKIERYWSELVEEILECVSGLDTDLEVTYQQ